MTANTNKQPTENSPAQAATENTDVHSKAQATEQLATTPNTGEEWPGNVGGEIEAESNSDAGEVPSGNFDEPPAGSAPVVDANEGDAEDPDTGDEFKPARKIAGEILLRAGDLGTWDHHIRRASRLRGDHASALAIAAGDPMAIAPIEVIRTDDGRYVVKDGRFRLLAILEANGGDMDVQVRSVIYPGNEEDAVQETADAALGTIGASAMEQSQALLNLKRICNISQTAIAERYAGLTISKVSNMLIAARLRETYPVLFDILNEPDRAPIDYGVKVNKLKKALGSTGFKAVLSHAEELLATDHRLDPAQALAALRGDSPDDAVAGDETATTESGSGEPEPVFGFNDEPVGSTEKRANGAQRLNLPPRTVVTRMSAAEREEAARAFIVKVREHFGLKGKG